MQPADARIPHPGAGACAVCPAPGYTRSWMEAQFYFLHQAGRSMGRVCKFPYSWEGFLLLLLLLLLLLIFLLLLLVSLLYRLCVIDLQGPFREAHSHTSNNNRNKNIDNLENNTFAFHFYIEDNYLWKNQKCFIRQLWALSYFLLFGTKMNENALLDNINHKARLFPPPCCPSYHREHTKANCSQLLSNGKLCGGGSLFVVLWICKFLYFLNFGIIWVY